MNEKTEVSNNGKGILVTPTGKCEWAKILKPDTKWDSDGLYSIDLFLGHEESEGIIAGIRAAVQAYKNNIAEGDDIPGFAKPPFQETEDGYKFKFKQKAKSGEFDYTVDVYDRDTEVWAKDTLIGNGSEVKVAYDLYVWNVKTQGGIGCTLRLKAVQVINHVEYTRDAGSFGFKAEGESQVTTKEKYPIGDDIPF